MLTKLKCLNFYGARAPNPLKCLKLEWILELKSILCNLSKSVTIFDIEMVSYKKNEQNDHIIFINQCKSF